MKATSNALAPPIRSDPPKMIANFESAPKTSPPRDPFPRPLTVSYATIPIASLKILSPKTMEKRFSSAPSSLKMAKTATGSVAEIKLPNAKLSYRVNSGYQLSGVYFAVK
jgi:hypothetical protein